MDVVVVFPARLTYKLTGLHQERMKVKVNYGYACTLAGTTDFLSRLRGRCIGFSGGPICQVQLRSC